MKRRKFIASCAAFVVGCALGLGLKAIPKRRMVLVNPEWVHARYEIRYFKSAGGSFIFKAPMCPPRFNKPVESLEDIRRFFIPPFIEVEIG